MSGAGEIIRTGSEEETMAVASRLASRLQPGSVVLLTGDLGAGKTAFVRGLASGLGLAADEVSSPTFTLVQQYAGERGRVTLFHVDLYRVEGGEDEDLGLEELAGGGVVAIEWAEKLRRPFEGATRVEIVDLGGDRREIRILTSGGRTEGG